MADRDLAILTLPVAPKFYEQRDQDIMRDMIEHHWHPKTGGGSGGPVTAFATVELPLDNGISPLVDGMFISEPITFGYTITGYRLIEDCGVAGSVELRIDYASADAFPTFTEISGTQRPQLVGSHVQQRTTLDGWTQVVGQAYSQLRATVVGDAVAVTRVVVGISLQRTDAVVNGSSGGGGGGGSSTDDDTAFIGSVWSDGSGAPSDANGNNGDFYLNDTTGDVYTKSAGTWSIVANIKGASGSTGSAGAAGSVWHDGSGIPGAGLGADGDYYLDDATGHVYVKASGSWSIVATILGPAGAAGTAGSVWYDGSGAPSGGLGVDGDYYLDDSNGDVYTKVSGSWGIVTNIAGPSGTNGTAGAAGAAGRMNPFGACFDGFGSVLNLTGATKVTVGPMSASGTITAASIVTVSGPGSATFGVKKCARTSFPSSLADITGGHDLVLTSADEMEDSTLTGWSLSYSADDVFQFELKAVSGTITQATALLSP